MTKRSSLHREEKQKNVGTSRRKKEQGEPNMVTWVNAIHFPLHLKFSKLCLMAETHCLMWL